MQVKTRSVDAAFHNCFDGVIRVGRQEAPSAVFIIRSLEVGDHLVENIRGSIAPAQGTLLLGQSFLQNFKSWAIDNTKHALILE